MTIKAFDYLASHPKILVYEPTFRTAVINKMNELQMFINKRTNGFIKAEYNKAIALMKMSVRVNVTNSKMRNKIYENLDNISHTLSEYKDSVMYNDLKKSFEKLNTTLAVIKNHPYYVPLSAATV